MKIALFGGTGFVGSNLVKKLIDDGYQINLLVRSPEKVSYDGNVNVIEGNILDISSVIKTVENCDAIIYSIGILREVYGKTNLSFEEAHVIGVQNVIHAGKNNGIKRFILISALGSRVGGTEYQDSKARGGNILEDSKMDHTIFYPSILFGNPEGKMEFCTQVNNQIVNLPLPAPLFFSGINIFSAGRSLFAPVHIEEFVNAVVKSIELNSTIGQKIIICGKEKFTWKELIKIIASVRGKKKIFIPVPIVVLKLLTFIFGKFSWFPVSSGQLDMVSEGNAADSNCSEFGLPNPDRKFNLEELSYLKK